MLAPNGKPSNLNERQWHQARSVPFLRWFGNWRYDPNRAVKVVEVDASDMRKDVPDHKNVKAVFSWLVDNIFASSPVTVKSTGAKVGFSKRALNASLKRRGKEQRRAYAGLKRLIADAEYFGFEQADKKHARSLDGQDIYYSAMRLDGQDYSVKIKIDIAKTDKTSTYKDHKVSSIEIAPVVSPSLARESGEPTARPGATSSYKISTLAGNVKPETSKVLDKNGEPPSSTITEFERENPNVLRKDSTDAPRGMHTVEDGRSVLTFFQAKDLSTAPHEIYHVFRWMFADLAQDERAPQWLGDDWAKALCNTKCNTQDGN